MGSVKIALYNPLKHKYHIEDVTFIGGGKKSNKKTSKQNKMVNSVKQKSEGSPAVVKTKVKEDKAKIKEEESEDSDGSDVDTAEINDRSSEEEVKSSSVEDDDQVWKTLM